MLKRTIQLIALILAAGLPIHLQAQTEGQQGGAEAVEGEEEGAPRGGEEEETPVPPPKQPAKGKPDQAKLLLAEIAKVHKAQIAFGNAEFEQWRNFWTKLRDERGLYEVRMSKQRQNFMESLRSLDPQDRGQSLADFETLQTNQMRAFEEKQAAKIGDFVNARVERLRSFGVAQESERARLSQASASAWVNQRAQLKIDAGSPEKDSKKASKKSSNKASKDERRKSEPPPGAVGAF